MWLVGRHLLESLYLTHMISVSPAGHSAARGKTLNTGVFSVFHTDDNFHRPVHVHFVILAYFRGHSIARFFQNSNFVWLSYTVTWSLQQYFFVQMWNAFKGDNWHVSGLGQSPNVGVILDSILVRSLKLYTQSQPWFRYTRLYQFGWPDLGLISRSQRCLTGQDESSKFSVHCIAKKK